MVLGWERAEICCYSWPGVFPFSTLPEIGGVRPRSACGVGRCRLSVVQRPCFFLLLWACAFLAASAALWPLFMPRGISSRAPYRQNDKVGGPAPDVM